MTIFRKEKEDTNIIICSNGKKKIHRKQHILKGEDDIFSKMPCPPVLNDISVDIFR